MMSGGTVFDGFGGTDAEALTDGFVDALGLVLGFGGTGFGGGTDAVTVGLGTTLGSTLVFFFFGGSSSSGAEAAGAGGGGAGVPDGESAHTTATTIAMRPTIPTAMGIHGGPRRRDSSGSAESSGVPMSGMCSG